MASLTSGTANLGEGRAVFGPRGRIAARVLLYSLVSIQFVIILSIMREMCQAHPLSLGILVLPILYLSPLVMWVAFRQQINTLLRRDMVSVKVADICNDWITIILLFVYPVIWDFRQLHL